ncbi:hypothetical protein POX_c04479 [Penicillium oxalicum]|uniref:hypothetical protein n=1 Tax=Penicillium oxalicum TaxID=69781 RepID=UPI0020B64DFB|nr:hypothetical protein POX_c04479 [Penicillium oxalicum]KAI2791613.1 hypothetical protein POX_c04479 [Penicillium oxalicum]
MHHVKQNRRERGEGLLMERGSTTAYRKESIVPGKAKLNAITILVNREKPQREGSEKGPNCEERIEYGGWNMNGFVHSPVSSPRTHSKTSDTAGEKRPMKSLEVSGMKIPIRPDRSSRKIRTMAQSKGPEKRLQAIREGEQKEPERLRVAITSISCSICISDECQIADYHGRHPGSFSMPPTHLPRTSLLFPLGRCSYAASNPKRLDVHCKGITFSSQEHVTDTSKK